MNKVLTIPVLVILLVALFVSSASAEWLYATDGKTFVHTEPDIDSERLGVFRKSQKIWVYDHTYTSDGRNWCTVRFNDQEAFISDRYSSYTVDNEDEFEDVNQGYDEDFWMDDDWDDEYEWVDEFEFMTDFHFKAKKDVTVYDWFYDGDKIGTIKKGTVVTASIIRTSDDGRAWVEIPGHDNYDYGYVDVSKMEIQERSFPKLSNVMKVTGNTIHIRDDAHINANSLQIVSHDTKLYVDYFVCVYDEEYRIWAHCNDKHGMELGFASCKYLDAA